MRWNVFIVDHSGVSETSIAIPNRRIEWRAALQELSVRAKYVLTCYNEGEIASWEELSKHSKDSILDLKNCGKHTLKEIITWAAKHGIEL